MESGKTRPEILNDYGPLPSSLLFAQEVAAEIISNLSDMDIIRRIETECQRLDENYDWAADAFDYVESILKNLSDKTGGYMSLKTSPGLYEQGQNVYFSARGYFHVRFLRQARKTNVVDTLAEIDTYLNRIHLKKCFRDGLEWAKEDLEKEFEVELTRRKRKKELAEFDDPDRDQVKRLIMSEERLQERIESLQQELTKVRQEKERKVVQQARDRGLTIRRLVFLLEEEMPRFKAAQTKKERAAFAFMLTGLGGGIAGKEGEKIRQELTYHNDDKILDEDREWLELWKSRLKKVP